MKKIFFGVLLLALTSIGKASSNTEILTQPLTNVNIPAVKLTNENGVAAASSVTTVIKAYLQLKDALVADNGQLAAAVATGLSKALGQLEKDLKDPSVKQAYNKDGKAAVKAAEAIGSTQELNAQRKSFGSLSDHLYRLIKVTGAPEALYLDYCPMAKASWLSDKEPIENPYYGKSMLTCGSVKETIEGNTK